MAPDRGSCYAGRMSLVATLAMLMLMPAAAADASRSGIHTGGEECAMPAWLHSEWRLLHAYVPACSGPARASLSGKRDFKTRDEGTETASLIQFLLCRDRALARDPANWGLFDESPEILVRV